MIQTDEFERWTQGSERRPWGFGARESDTLLFGAASSVVDYVYSWCWQDSLCVRIPVGRLYETFRLTSIRSEIIDHLIRKFQDDQDVVVIYYYFDYKDHEGQTMTKIITGMMEQLLVSKKHPESWTKVYELYNESCRDNRDPIYEEYKEVFESQLRHFKRVFIITNAMDEADEENGTLQDFLEFLELRCAYPTV